MQNLRCAWKCDNFVFSCLFVSLVIHFSTRSVSNVPPARFLNRFSSVRKCLRSYLCMRGSVFDDAG